MYLKKLLLLILVLSNIGLSAQTLKLMTYNIRLEHDADGENAWIHRKDFLTSQILFYEPDIAGFQEVTPNQLDYLSKILSQYAIVGIGRDGIGKGESSNIIYKKNRFKLIETQTFWLSETPDKISKGWDAAFNRVCTYALLKDIKTNKHFWVFNTHLDHIGEEARTNSIQLILNKIALLNTKNYPVIFMGDFNSEPTSDRINLLKKTMDDTRDITLEKPFGPAGTFNGFKHHEPVTLLIDYIFISKNNSLKVKKYAILSDSNNLKYPSDHLPVYVELSFK